MLGALCSWFHDRGGLSGERSLPMLLPLLVSPLFPYHLQEYDHDAHRGISPILPIPAKPNWLSPAPQELLRLAGKAKQSLDEKEIVFVIPVVKGQYHPRFFHL